MKMYNGFTKHIIEEYPGGFQVKRHCSCVHQDYIIKVLYQDDFDQINENELYGGEYCLTLIVLDLFVNFYSFSEEEIQHIQQQLDSKMKCVKSCITFDLFDLVPFIDHLWQENFIVMEPLFRDMGNKMLLLHSFVSNTKTNAAYNIYPLDRCTCSNREATQKTCPSCGKPPWYITINSYNKYDEEDDKEQYVYFSLSFDQSAHIGLCIKTNLFRNDNPFVILVQEVAKFLFGFNIDKYYKLESFIQDLYQTYNPYTCVKATLSNTSVNRDIDNTHDM